MKRLHILFGLTLVCLSMPNVVLGANKKACTGVFSCEHDAKGAGRQGYLPMIEGSKTQCWGCGIEDGMCDDGQVVPQKDGLGEIIAIYQCDRRGFGYSNKFDKITPDVWCKNSDIRLSTIPENTEEKNFKKTLSTKDATAANYKNVGNITVFDGSNYCVFAKCNAGYMPNSDKTECIADTRRDDCEKTSGTWAGGSCTCDSNKHLKQSTDKLTCVCDDGYVDASNVDTRKLECVASQETIAEQNAKRCRNSGGQWQNDGCVCASSKNLTKSGDVCVCKQGYEYESNKADGCKMTQATANAQDKNKCNKSKESGQPVEWDDKAKKCYCNGVTGQYKDIRDNGKIYHCEETDNYIACKKLGSNANWHNGECTCKDPTKQFKNGHCNINTQEYQDQLDAEAAAIAAAKLSEKIEKIGKTLDAVTDTFEISKWRNADGEFNTARLASDSVAAVVLGTAGGLISSKVIKKKQIEDGFEDIKCIIGSQTVADYGDEFQVGIQ